MRDAKLTEREQAVIENLTEAYNIFVELPNHHPSDCADFTHYIHVLQRHVMARLARRCHLELFPQLLDKRYT